MMRVGFGFSASSRRAPPYRLRGAPPPALCEGGVRVGRGGEVGGYSKSSRCDDDVGMKFRGEGWRCACVCVWGGGGGSKPTRRM